MVICYVMLITSSTGLNVGSAAPKFETINFMLIHNGMRDWVRRGVRVGMAGTRSESREMIINIVYRISYIVDNNLSVPADLNSGRYNKLLFWW